MSGPEDGGAVCGGLGSTGRVFFIKRSVRTIEKSEAMAVIKFLAVLGKIPTEIHGEMRSVL